MQIPVFAMTFAPALALAGVMGFAIQRGNTCTVAAVDQVLSEGRWQRFCSIVEAALWVLGGLLLARAVGLSPMLPSGYATSGLTLAGGVLLGLGAFVNRACAFGAIARLGSGESSYLATPLGFYLGCRSARALLGDVAPPALAFVEPSSSTLVAIACLLAAWMTWRLGTALARRHAGAASSLPARLRHALTQRVWQPAAATAVIGATFVGLMLLVGAWAYTDGLVDLARGAPMSVPARTLLLVALLSGALLGCLRSGRFQGMTPMPLLRCLCGGALMGAGSSLIPRGNDGLLLAS